MTTSNLTIVHTIHPNVLGPNADRIDDLRYEAFVTDAIVREYPHADVSVRVRRTTGSDHQVEIDGDVDVMEADDIRAACRECARLAYADFCRLS
jgi:hypothetical protein